MLQHNIFSLHVLQHNILNLKQISSNTYYMYVCVISDILGL